MPLQYRADTNALLYITSTDALMAECCCEGEGISSSSSEGGIPCNGCDPALLETYTITFSDLDNEEAYCDYGVALNGTSATINYSWHAISECTWFVRISSGLPEYMNYVDIYLYYPRRFAGTDYWRFNLDANVLSNIWCTGQVYYGPTTPCDPTGMYVADYPGNTSGGTISLS